MTVNRLETIRMMLETGEHTLRSVAAHVGCSRQEVHRLAQKHGISTRGGRAAWTALNKTARAQKNPVVDIISAYQGGASLENVSVRVGVSRHIVTRILLDAGTQLRVYTDRSPRTAERTPAWRSEDVSYPYLSNDRTDPTGLLALVNSLVPPHVPHFIRADVCQDVLLGILEGAIAPGELKASVLAALRRVRKMHPSLFGPISLDRVIPGTDGLRMIDLIPNDHPHF